MEALAYRGYFVHARQVCALGYFYAVVVDVH